MKTNYIFFAVALLFLLACKDANSSSTAVNKKNITSYNDIINKTFFILQNEGNQLIYDSYGVDDMTEKIRFRERKINHLIPMDWHNYKVIDKISKEELLQLQVKYINEPNKNTFNYFLRYDKQKHLLYSYPNNEIRSPKIYIDSIYLNTIEQKKYSKKKGVDVGAIITNKKVTIFLQSKKTEILIPFLEEYIYFEENIAGKQGISETLEVKLLKGTKGKLYFVFGEGKCGACPSFSALYDLNGKNLSYKYSVRMNIKESKVLISEGNENEIFKKYGLSGSDIDIQINHQDTPTYLIKKWID